MTVKAKGSEASDAVASVTSGFEQTATAIKDGMFKATAGFQTTQAQVKENVEKAMKTAEEMLAFNQGNFEAVVKSGRSGRAACRRSPSRWWPPRKPPSTRRWRPAAR